MSGMQDDMGRRKFTTLNSANFCMNNIALGPPYFQGLDIHMHITHVFSSCHQIVILVLFNG